MLLRFAHDADNLYVLAETCYNDENENIDIQVKTKLYSFGQKLASVGLSAYGELSTSGGAVSVIRKGRTNDSRKGFCIETQIPLNTLNVSSGNTIYVNATVGEKTFTSSDESSSPTWQRLKIL